jgi:hypothetical protein
MVFNAKSEGSRGVGRPRLRWLDYMEVDIKALSLELKHKIEQSGRQYVKPEEEEKKEKKHSTLMCIAL